jgi:hypothetical protein
MQWIRFSHTYIGRNGMFLGGQSYQLGDERIAYLKANGARFEIVPAPWDRGKDPLAEQRRQLVDLKIAALGARNSVKDKRQHQQEAQARRDELYRRYKHLELAAKNKKGKPGKLAPEVLEASAAEGRYITASAELQLAELAAEAADQAVKTLAEEIAAAEAAAQPQPQTTETTDATDTPTATPTAIPADDAGDGLAASVIDYEAETGITITNGHGHAGGQDAAPGNDGGLPR